MHGKPDYTPATYVKLKTGQEVDTDSDSKYSNITKSEKNILKWIKEKDDEFKKQNPQKT